MFDPALFNIESEHGGIHDVIYKSISACKIDDQSYMYENVVLNGGNTRFPRFPERLKRMIATLALSTVDIGICAPPERSYSTWIGGSIIASSPNFELSLIGKQDYEETGPKVVHEKCFL